MVIKDALDIARRVLEDAEHDVLNGDEIILHVLRHALGEGEHLARLGGGIDLAARAGDAREVPDDGIELGEHGVAVDAHARKERADQAAVLIDEGIEQMLRGDILIAVLLRPGTSLGGARPKASVTAPDGSLWIAKFPSKEDDFDAGAWEYLVHVLAEEAGVCVPAARAQKFSKTGTTFLCRRFDREGSRRIPFASAMTMLGCEDRQEDGNGTYIDMAGFLMQHGAKPDTDLPELWRRMVFSLLVANTDDHLRNHGFILENGRWRLSPAYDLNANVKRPQSLSLELDAGVPIESIDTLLDAAEYFRLGKEEANVQLKRIRSAVAKWRDVAVRLGISRREQEEMSECFVRR